MHILLKHHHKIIHPAGGPTPTPYLDLTQAEEHGIVKFDVDQAVLYGGEPLDVWLFWLSLHLDVITVKRLYQLPLRILLFCRQSMKIPSFSSFYLLPFHISAVMCSNIGYQTVAAIFMCGICPGALM